MLEAIQSQTSVTASRFIDADHVAGGCGSFLKIYNWRTANLVETHRVLTSNKIHGIQIHKESSTTLSIIWGGNELVILDKQTLNIVRRHTLKDRIVHVQCSDNIFYVLTAHNEVLTIGNDDEVKDRFVCDERSILYSGSLWITANAKLAAAGTVFGGVVVWDIHTQKIVRRFEEHEGSIFDVAWSPDGTMLASCSDDRAIIVSNIETGETSAKGWGHISRIWKLSFVSGNRLLSAAEDCSVRLWEFSGHKELTCSKISIGHKGKSVWAIDVMSDIAVSGGGDGRIMLWDLDVPVESTKYNIDQTFGKTGVRSCVILASSEASTDAAQTKIAATTSSGQTYFYNGAEWVTIGKNSASVASVKDIGDKFYSLAANGNGLSYNYKSGEIEEFQLGYAVSDFFVLSNDLSLIVPVPPSRECVITSSNPDVPDRVFAMPDNVWQPTCAMMTTDGRVCIGTRKGDLVSYIIGQNEAKACSLKALGVDAVTSIRLIECTEKTSLVLATNRVSEYGIYNIDTLERLLMTRARKKGSIEGQYEHTQGQLMWGFQNDTFVSWNADLGFEFSAIPCGGAHRAWDFRVFENHSVFAYVRAAELYIHTAASPSPKFSKPLLQHGTHGREIRGMETCPTNNLIMATASEDTTINMYWSDPDYQYAECKSTVTDGHISGIQASRWHPDGKSLFTSAGQGELVMWNVQTEGSRIFAREASRMPVKRTVQQELRIMDFAFYKNLIAVAYSDSSFRIYGLPTADDCKSYHGHWDLLIEGKYRECCLSNIDFYESNNTLWLLISSTDGHLVGYKIPADNELKLLDASPLFRFRIHQSSVRCATLIASDTGLIYYSGGDDNALHGLELTFQGENQVKMREIFHIADGHASAVTSIVVKDNALFTVGSDQRIKIWTLDGESSASAFSGVADTGTLVVQDQHIIAGGIGIEFFKYNI